MGRKYIKYNKDLICEICGVFGAYDFSEDDIFICPECLRRSLKSLYKLKREIKIIYPKDSSHKSKQRRKNDYKN